MTSYIRAQIAELKDSKALTLFGLFLTFTHFVTWYFWSSARHNFVAVLTKSLPLCWSYFQSCHLIRPMNLQLAQGLLWIYLGFSASALFFLALKKIKYFWWSLFFLTFMKWLFLSQDYRFMGNYHYMAIILSLVYLFIPAKKKVLPIFMISFYVSAGLLKFTPEWYSGATLLRPAFIQGKALSYLLIYVIYLEVLFVWGLLHPRSWVRWATFGQLVLFHGFSWHIVGYFYPVIMFNLLSLFPLLWLIKEPEQRPWSKAGTIAIACFWCAQLFPFVFYKDSALTGQGRILSLNMLDAWSVCQSTAVIKMKNQQLFLNLPSKELGVRIQCDPTVYVSIVREECARWKRNPEFIDLDYVLQTKFKTGDSAQEVVKLINACSRPPKLDFLGSISQ